MATNEMYRQLLSQAVHKNGSSLLGGNSGGAMIGGKVNTYGVIKEPKERKGKGPPTEPYTVVKFEKLPPGTKLLPGQQMPYSKVTLTLQQSIDRYNKTRASRQITSRVNDSLLAGEVQKTLNELNSNLKPGEKPRSRINGEELAKLKYRVKTGTQRARRVLKKEGVENISEGMLKDSLIRAKGKGSGRIKGSKMTDAEKLERDRKQLMRLQAKLAGMPNL